MLRIGLLPAGDRASPLPGMPIWLSQLLRARGVETEEAALRFLNPAWDQLLPSARLQDMEKAAQLLSRAKEAGQKVVIYGDYDVDGVCASAILYEALGQMGLEREVYIPDRHQEGYGLNMPAVEKLAEKYQVMVTVDCGITSVAEVKRARELGMAVIVTDHHRHGETLPPANAVITPLLGDYPFPFLCGAGVAWKLALQLVGEKGKALMEVAALATVADMVPLTGENRVIVALGLKQLANTRRPGLRAVMNRAGIRDTVSSDQVAFQIAPRMNACGRMESARIALEMLLTKEPVRGEEAALQMEKLNQERKNQESQVLEEALRQVEKMDLVERRAIVVCGENWNSGVVGLAAGKVAEKYSYPTVALSRDGDTCVGSARSAGNVDIHKALSECSDLFERFGGHKQAAGLTMKAENLPAFERRLSRAVAEQTGDQPVIPEILCDGEMRLDEVTEETVRYLSRLEPFGMGNPAPRFLVEGAQALSLRAVGAEGKHLKCSFQQDRVLRDGIFFGGGEWAGKSGGRFRLAMSPNLNEFRGRVSAECRLFAMELETESLQRNMDKEGVFLFGDALGETETPETTLQETDEVMAGCQGTLLLCRCLETALKMKRRYPQADFCLEKADDPRAFHTILLYGRAQLPCAPFRWVILCDGDFGEGGAWQKACPKAVVTALPLSRAVRDTLQYAYLDVTALRGVYLAIKKQLPNDLSIFSGQLGISPAQGAFALRVLAQIGLIDFSLTPFRTALLPMVKRGPEESGLFRLARRAKEER